MTLSERELLLTLAWAAKSQMQLIAVGTPFDPTAADSAVRLIDAKTEAVLVAGLTNPAPVMPRAKYVRIEHAPADTRFTCQSCGDDGNFLVRIGEYYDPSALLCPTCIREAAQLLDAG